MDNKLKKRALLDDLEKELWIRQRNSGGIKWIDENNNEIDIREMSEQYLFNCITRLRYYDLKRAQKEKRLFEQEIDADLYTLED